MNSQELITKLVERFTHSPRVLIVDDDENFVVLFRHTLEECGCIVDVSTETESAVDKIRYQTITNHPYDLIFLDLKMPPHNGTYVLSRAKELSPKTPVVIVTGYPDSDLVSEALKFGYLGLISKPIDFKELELLFWKHKISLQPSHT